MWRLTIAQGYESFGLIVQPNGDISYREWAPNAVEASLVGDFSTFHPHLNRYSNY
jgi:1,4-alpha-glucan branching enzyme